MPIADKSLKIVQLSLAIGFVFDKKALNSQKQI